MQDRIMATGRVDNAQDTRLLSGGTRKIHVKFVYIDWCIYTTIVVLGRCYKQFVLCWCADLFLVS